MRRSEINSIARGLAAWLVVLALVVGFHLVASPGGDERAGFSSFAFANAEIDAFAPGCVATGDCRQQGRCRDHLLPMGVAMTTPSPR